MTAFNGQRIDELANKISHKLSDLKTHTGGFTLDQNFCENLKQTVERFNGFAQSGKDIDFNREEFNDDRLSIRMRKCWMYMAIQFPAFTAPETASLPRLRMRIGGAGSTIGPALTFGYIAGLKAVMESEK